MYAIKPLPNFIEWLDGLADEKTRGIISARIKRLIILLAGGSKSTRKNDIKRAKKLAALLD